VCCAQIKPLKNPSLKMFLYHPASPVSSVKIDRKIATEHTYNLPDSENLPSGQIVQHNPEIHQNSFQGMPDYLYFF
jgi:hypothetical protein